MSATENHCFAKIWRNIYNSILHLHYTLICSKSIDRTTTSKSGAKVLCQDKNKGLIPLKNELGEIRIGQIYLCNEAENYFAGSIVPSCRCSGECSRFAQFVRTKELCDVYFDDLKITARLTEDDIESLQDDYFKHGANILESCVEHQLISNDLMERYHLGALQKQEYFIEPDEFPNEPIRNLNALQNSINNALFKESSKRNGQEPLTAYSRRTEPLSFSIKIMLAGKFCVAIRLPGNPTASAKCA